MIKYWQAELRDNGWVTCGHCHDTRGEAKECAVTMERQLQLRADLRVVLVSGNGNHMRSERV